MSYLRWIGLNVRSIQYGSGFDWSEIQLSMLKKEENVILRGLSSLWQALIIYVF